jgi:hypothetical protein
MFIRQTKTNTSSSGEAYLTYRLVESRREGKKFFQRTLLNIGRNFTLPREDWSELCVRIDQILNGKKPLFPAGPAIEKQAQLASPLQKTAYSKANHCGNRHDQKQRELKMEGNKTERDFVAVLNDCYQQQRD